LPEIELIKGDVVSKPKLVTSSDLVPMKPTTPGLRFRWIVPPTPEGWQNPPISEWTLTEAGMSDLHPHEESAFVLEGELHVEVDGHTVIAGVGDYVTVPAGSTGRYWAPKHARMLSVYGANPTGMKSEYIEYWEIAK
jgi:mannose-6-phosphate isomerase-like protein (cupin superfamily)